ncbi:hypothetical protein HMPREF9413_4228 [Paenibacillus sp. HGF7]|nr:hypothetical protein HMPREF9413_4228 [Paenibacillus sp. HGF7]
MFMEGTHLLGNSPKIAGCPRFLRASRLLPKRPMPFDEKCQKRENFSLIIKKYPFFW